MLATGFKADYDKTWSMQFWKIDSILIAQTGRFRDCCKNLLPLWKGFERINYVLLPLKSSDNYRFSEDFRRKKINYFAQIESIREVHYGDNLLQVLFLNLFMLESVGVHFSNNFGIIGSFVVVVIINILFILFTLE